MGSCFTARSDLSGGIRVDVPAGLDRSGIARDVACAIGYHAANILPDLASFSGYDTIRFDFIDQPKT